MHLKHTHVTVYDGAVLSYFLVPFDHDCVICLDFHRSPKITECGHVFCHTCLVDCVREYKFCPECDFLILNYFSVRWEFFEEITVGCEVLMKRGDCFDVKKVTIDDRREFPHAREYFLADKDLDTVSSQECRGKEKTVKNQNTGGIQLTDRLRQLVLGTPGSTFRNSCTEKIAAINLNRRDNENRMRGLFFQSNDGQPYFMNAKGVQYLKKKFKLYENMPEYVLCKVVSIKKSVVGDREWLKHLHRDFVVYIVEVCFEL